MKVAYPIEQLTAPEALAALRIAQELREAGFDALLVGGCVRDLLLELDPKDFDIATNATPAEVHKLYPKAVLVGAKFGVVVVPMEGQNIEVATFREETGYSDKRRPDAVKFSTAENDARRRDFTINGLFLDPVSGHVEDFVGGVVDLQARVLRAIGKPEDQINEDSLRLLRAVRFASSLAFTVEPETWEAVCRFSHQIEFISPERIRDELIKGLTAPNPEVFIELLSQSGLLMRILPEVEALKGCEQPPEFHPEGDVYVHTKLVLSHLPAKPSAELAMAALLHDIGKPETYTKTDRVRFNGHDKAGAEMADAICRRLVFSNDQRESIVSMVVRHMHFINFPKLRVSTMRRFLAVDTIHDELELHRADSLGSNGSLSTYELAKMKLEEARAEAAIPRLPAPFITGDDLIALGLTPGPHFKSILQEAFDEQLENRLCSREDALKWIKNYVRNLKS